jgi:antitoxin VapB
LGSHKPLGRRGAAANVARPYPEHMPALRRAALFRNGRNQAVRIPREFEMEGTEVLMHKEGDRLILTPVRRNRLLDLLASWEPLDEGLPDVEDTPPQTREGSSVCRASRWKTGWRRRPGERPA